MATSELSHSGVVFATGASVPVPTPSLGSALIREGRPEEVVSPLGSPAQASLTPCLGALRSTTWKAFSSEAPRSPLLSRIPLGCDQEPSECRLGFCSWALRLAEESRGFPGGGGRMCVRHHLRGIVTFKHHLFLPCDPQVLRQLGASVIRSAPLCPARRNPATPRWVSKKTPCPALRSPALCPRARSGPDCLLLPAPDCTGSDTVCF